MVWGWKGPQRPPSATLAVAGTPPTVPGCCHDTAGPWESKSHCQSISCAVKSLIGASFIWTSAPGMLDRSPSLWVWEMLVGPRCLCPSPLGVGSPSLWDQGTPQGSLSLSALGRPPRATPGVTWPEIPPAPSFPARRGLQTPQDCPGRRGQRHPRTTQAPCPANGRGLCPPLPWSRRGFVVGLGGE